MWPYAAVFAVLAFGAFTAGPLRGQLDKPHWIVLPAIILTLFIGLRVQVGGDWYVYLRIFAHCASLDPWSAMNVKVTDPAYGLLNWLAGQAGAGIWAVNLVCAAIFVTGLWSFCRMQTSPPLALSRKSVGATMSDSSVFPLASVTVTRGAAVVSCIGNVSSKTTLPVVTSRITSFAPHGWYATWWKR